MRRRLPDLDVDRRSVAKDLHCDLNLRVGRFVPVTVVANGTVAIVDFNGLVPQFDDFGNVFHVLVSSVGAGAEAPAVVSVTGPL
tara:strand:- start:189 stop:440 length:252 start_codon:yes stop_codon:yes gene_type:complete